MSRPGGPTAQLRLADAPELRLPDGATPIVLAPRDAALLAWLALEGPTARARLAALLWPGSDAEAARNALRQRLFQLRRQAGRALVTGQATLALADGLAHDLHDADGVLGDLASPADGELAQWLARQRARRRSRIALQLGELAQMAEDAHDHDDALAHARELLALDPLSETAHRRLMRLHYLAGDRAAALLAFDRCEQVLKDEVGARPAPATLQLLALIEQAAGPGGAAAAPRELPAALLRPPRMVGRDAELGELLQATHDGVPFLLLGEAGLGKSRLLQAWAQAQPRAVLARARPGDADVPLALLGRLLAQWPAGDADDARALEPLRARLAPEAADGGRRAGAPLDAALRALFERAAARGLALVFDDWQFADDASVALIVEVAAALGAQAPRLGHASRPDGEPARGRVAVLRATRPLRVVTLAPLPASAVRELLAGLPDVGDGAAVGALADALLQRVGGNPLFVLEALRHIAHRRLPFEPAHVAAPRQVRDLVAQRLERLPDSARALVRVAAVAGSDFGIELAEAVSARHALELVEAWQWLDREALFGPAGALHDVHAEVALEGLPEPIARLLHARVAAWLEPRGAAPARLARHWLAAGDAARAVPHLVAAARHAWNAARPQETFELFGQAAEIEAGAGRGDAAFDLWFEAADAMTEIGPAALAQRCLAALEARQASAAQRLRTRLVAAVLQVDAGPRHAGMARVAALLADAVALRDVRVECECRFALVHQAGGEGAFDTALGHLDQGERLLLASGDERRATAFAAMRVLVTGLRGQARQAAADAPPMQARLARLGDQATRAVLGASQALQRARLGEIDAALDEAAQALALARDAGIAVPDLTLVRRYAVEALRWAGRFDLALDAFEALSRRIDGGSGSALDAGAALYLHLGRADLAHPALAAWAAEPGLPPRRERLRRALLAHQHAAFDAAVPPAPPPDALDGEDLPLAAEWAVWGGFAAQPAWPRPALQALHARCVEAGLALWAAPLGALLGCAPAAPLPPASAGVPWVAWLQARAHDATGDASAALAQARHGVGWLEQVAQTQLAAPFREAFLHRHPLHRALRARLTRA